MQSPVMPSLPRQSASGSAPNTVYIARQPILDGAGRVFAYELLYRDAAHAQSCTTTGDEATARLLTNALLSIGLGTLTEGRPAFCNVTERLLLTELETLLPSQLVTLELREDIPANSDTLDACRRLRAAGFDLAVDDFEEGSAAEAFVTLAQYVKVDVLTTPEHRWEPIARRLRRHGVRLVAEKVETAEVATAARRAGYELFQGYFFCRPSTMSGQAVLPARAGAMNLLVALRDPDLTIDSLERLISRDVSLTYRVLRCLHSAGMGLRMEVTSLRSALVLLGVEPVRTWASLWVLADVNGPGYTETITLALMRARACEHLGRWCWGADAASECFLLGLCSLLDVMLHQPMEHVLEALPLRAPIRGALLGDSNDFRAVLQAVIAYERGQWPDAQVAAQRTGLPAEALIHAYRDAVEWTHPLAHALLSSPR